MNFSLSTSYFTKSAMSAEEFLHLAKSMGFDAVELGYAIFHDQYEDFKILSSILPITSVHAFAPLPLSAPYAHPELYEFGAEDEGMRFLARHQVMESIRYAAELGAKTLVLHAGRVEISDFFHKLSSSRLRSLFIKGEKSPADKKYSRALALAVKNRRKNGLKRYETLKKELDGMVKTLLEHNIVLALENMPYLEGFPDESELERFVGDFKGAPIKLWYDSGHQHIRGVLGYNSKSSDEWKAELESLAVNGMIRGMHINDVLDIDDDHFAPGEGNVDFVSFEKVAKNVEHIVFEPNANVDPSKLKAGLKYLKEIWK